MYFQDIGCAVRSARVSRSLTQEALATRAHVSRVTINQLEQGVFPDLGVKKLLAILKEVGLDLSLQPCTKPSQPDYLDLACISANVSYRERLTPDILAQTLLTGKVPPKLGPQLRVVFDEIPPAIFRGMVQQVSRWRPRPEDVLKHVRDIGESIGASRRLCT